jgi:hypothetical protein
MPSVVGLSAREASLVAVRHGLMVELQGSGRVIAQLPEPGDELDPGMTCRLFLARDAGTAAPAAPILVRAGADSETRLAHRANGQGAP